LVHIASGIITRRTLYSTASTITFPLLTLKDCKGEGDVHAPNSMVRVMKLRFKKPNTLYASLIFKGEEISTIIFIYLIIQFFITIIICNGKLSLAPYISTRMKFFPLYRHSIKSRIHKMKMTWAPALYSLEYWSAIQTHKFKC